MMDAELERPPVTGGASIYPFAWNVLLAARHEGFAGTITTLAIAHRLAISATLAALEGVPHRRVTYELTSDEVSIALSRVENDRIDATVMSGTVNILLQPLLLLTVTV